MREVPPYTPKSRAARWLEARLPILGLIHSAFVAFPVPRNLNYLWTFGGILSFMLVAQIITGVVLSMHYTADASTSFASVEHIMRDVNYGWLLRYAHSSGASMFFLAVYIHIFRGMYYGSYKAPREVLWIVGVVILLLMMATAFTGYVLPWGQMSFWAAKVITSLFGAIPFVGQAITTWLWGGYSVDNPTLNRFYSLHFLLPFVIVGIVMLHIWALHVVGQNNPTGIEVKDIEKETVRFTPYASIKDVFALVCFMILFAGFIFYAPNFLLAAENFQEANPLQTPAHIVPEWYFLPFYAILRAIPSKLIGVTALFSSLAILAFLPWLDTSPVRSGTFRPMFKVFFWMLVLVSIGLGYLGAQPPEGGYIVAARVLTAYYFLHFLIILPLVGWLERPYRLPAAIANARSPETAPPRVHSYEGERP